MTGSAADFGLTKAGDCWCAMTGYLSSYSTAGATDKNYCMGLLTRIDMNADPGGELAEITRPVFTTATKIASTGGLTALHKRRMGKMYWCRMAHPKWSVPLYDPVAIPA